MMASWWATPMAAETFPEVAKGMNEADKIVFSTTMQKADWHNTKIIGRDIIEEIRRMKQVAGKDMTILGSGSIVSQFAEAGLIDTYQIMIDPVAISKGTPIFSTIQHDLNLELTGHRVFKSGTVLLSYKPLNTQTK